MKSCGLHSPTPDNKKSHVPFKLPAAEPQWGVWNLSWGKRNTDVQPDFQWVVLEIVDKLCMSQRYLQTVGSLHSKGCFNFYTRPHCFILYIYCKLSLSTKTQNMWDVQYLGPECHGSRSTCSETQRPLEMMI